MRYGTYVARRTLFAAFAVFVVVSLTFAVVTFTPNTNLEGTISLMERYSYPEAEIQEFVREYKTERGLDDPIHERYVGYLVDTARFEFGTSFGYNAPVSELLWPGIQRTLLYVLPAVGFAAVGGALLGGLSGSLRGGLPDWLARVSAYAAVGVPAFIAAFVFLAPFEPHVEWLNTLSWRAPPFYRGGLHPGPYNPNSGLWPPSKPWRFLVPAGVMALSLVGWQLRYVRTAYLDRANDDSVKLHWAKGAGRLRVARHVLRNAAVPIVSASLSELLVVVLLNLYVIETVFGIQGVAALNMIAVRLRDVPLIIGTTVVLAVGGVLASYVQDLLYGYLDPQIGAE